jgi:hypothetical protein
LTAFAPDLTVLEMEDADTDERSEDCDDFAEDFLYIRKVKKKEKNSAHLYMIKPGPNDLSLFLFINPDGFAQSHEG